jgi:hypothetical protein
MEGGVPSKFSTGGSETNNASRFSWRWKCRFQGKEKLMALAKYPETTLADTRVRRDAAPSC